MSNCFIKPLTCSPMRCWPGWGGELWPQRQIGWSILLAAVALTTAYGVSDEIHQLFVPGRHARLADVFFDAGGALTMILLIRRVKWLRVWPDSLSLPFSEGLKRGT